MQENPDNCTLCVVIISTINNFSLLRHHLFLPSSFTKFLYCYNKCKKLIQWNQIAIYTQLSLSSSLFSSAQFSKYVKEIIRETHIIVYQYTFLLATHTHTHLYKPTSWSALIPSNAATNETIFSQWGTLLPQALHKNTCRKCGKKLMPL